MADDPLAAMIAALNHAQRGKNAGKTRTPDQNNPMQPITPRSERRTQRPYADPTGETAIGNRKRKR